MDGMGEKTSMLTQRLRAWFRSQMASSPYAWRRFPIVT
jgi:hypothetical protein